MVTDLFRSHACMLKWQGQVSMLLGQLAASLSLKLYLAILNATVKPLCLVTLPDTWTIKLAPPEKPKKATMTPDPDAMKE